MELLTRRRHLQLLPKLHFEPIDPLHPVHLEQPVMILDNTRPSRYKSTAAPERGWSLRSSNR